MKRRGRFLIVLAATVLLLAIVVLPRISQAGRSKWFSAENKAARRSELRWCKIKSLTSPSLPHITTTLQFRYAT